MNQDEFKIRNTNAKESLIVSKILSCKSTDDIHALSSQALPDFLLHEPSPEAIKRIIEVFYKQLELLRFDEFKDRELADWKRVRAAIEHENTLVNHRLTWLLTSQGFLFAGFGVVYSSKTPLDLYWIAILIVVAVVGMAISFKIFIDIEDAARQLSDLDCWWHRTYAPEEYNQKKK